MEGDGGRWREMKISEIRFLYRPTITSSGVPLLNGLCMHACFSSHKYTGGKQHTIDMYTVHSLRTAFQFQSTSILIRLANASGTPGVSNVIGQCWFYSDLHAVRAQSVSLRRYFLGCSLHVSHNKLIMLHVALFD